MYKKNYRPNVAAIVLSSKYPEKVEILLANRIDLNNVWQVPQGGIDEGESPRKALYRELKEEIGTDCIEVIASNPKWISYDFPKVIGHKMYPYDGQIQKYYLVRLKEEAVVDIDTDEPEFDDFQFVQLESFFDYVNYFKRNVYKEVLDYFKKEGFI